VPIQGLQKQVISIPLKLGVDTKESPILVDNARFLSLTDAVFDRGALGEIHKRPGNAQIPGNDISGNPLTTELALAVFNDEIDICASGAFYAFGPELNAFIHRGPLFAASVKENSINKGANASSTPDSATLSGVTVYAWAEAGGVYCKVVSETNQSVYSPRTLLGSALSNPKVLADSANARLLVLCTNGSQQLVSFAIAVATPQTIGASHTIIAMNVANHSIFDAAIINGYLALVANFAGGSCYVLSVTLSTLAIDTTLQIVVQTALSIALVAQGTNAYVVLSYLSGGTQYLHGYFVAIPACTAVADAVLLTGSNSYPRVTAIKTATTTMTVYAEVSYQNQPSINNVQMLTHTVAGAVTLVGTACTGVAIASQPWLLSGNVYLMTVFPSTVQQTFFLQQMAIGSAASTVQGKFYLIEAGPPVTNSRMPQFQQVATGIIGLAVADQVAIESVNDALVVIDGVSEITLNYLGDGNGSATATIRSAQLGQTTFLATGCLLWGYAGSVLCEHGFNVYPEATTLTMLTSSLSIIVDNYDPTGATPGAVSIYVPDNGATPGGPVGSLILGGEYFTINGFVQAISGAPSTATPYLIWFKVNGAGSAPSGGLFSAYTMEEIDIVSSMTAAEVAQAIYTVVAPLTNSFWNAQHPAPVSLTNGWVGQRIQLLAKDVTVATAPPALNRTFVVTQTFQGKAGSYFTTFAVSCCPASLIRGGQYFTFLDGGAGINYAYVWFSVGGAGADPKPYAGAGNSIEVTLAGNETAQAVAVLVEAAIAAGSAHVTVTGPTTGGLGPVVGVTMDFEGPESAIYWAVNPSTGGVAQGYIGFNANGVDSLLTVNYAATYTWVDEQGQYHESDPSVPVTAYIPAYVTVGGTYPPAGTVVPPNAVIQIGVQNLTQTLKPNVQIAIYRTPSDPPSNPLAQVFYAVTNPPENDLPNAPTSVTPTTFVDYLSDTAIASNQALYTGGGVVEHDGPPASGYVMVHSNRIWLAALEDPTLWWYSGELQDGLGVWFSEGQTVRLPANNGGKVGGHVTAGASMDGNLVALQLYQPWLITGQGPDNTGNNGAFNFQIITSDVGCRDPGSVAVTPNGVVFKSTQGFRILNRSLQVTMPSGDGYDDVAAYNADVVSKAVVLDNGTKIIFLSFGGTTQLFDYLYGTWGQFSYQGVDGLVAPNGLFTFIRIDGAILQENDGSYEDVSTGYPMIAQTAKLKFAGVNGFQRVWKAFIQGHFKADQSYQIQITYDDEASPTQTLTFTPTADCSAFRIDLNRQLCKAVTFTIQDTAPYATGTTWGLDAIDLEVGVRKGGTQTIGSTRSVG
jgi:hypothetical protein